MAKKIIVVDDSSLVRQQLRVALEQAGYEVVEAEDGKQGLETIRSQRGASLVISDVNMPHMNGLDMLEAIKAGGQHTGLPIIVLTTEGKPELVDRAKSAGAAGWIIKPFKPNLLLAAVKKLAGDP